MVPSERATMADVAALEAQVKEAGEAVRLMKEANKATPGTNSKVCAPPACAFCRWANAVRCPTRGHRDAPAERVRLFAMPHAPRQRAVAARFRAVAARFRAEDDARTSRVLLRCTSTRASAICLPAAYRSMRMRACDARACVWVCVCVGG